MFKPDRIFSAQQQKTGMMEWYFQAREGNIGPYETREQADAMLQKFIATCIELGHTGGREQKDQSTSTALQVQNFLNFEAKGDIQWI